jgi:hypothetical protein
MVDGSFPSFRGRHAPQALRAAALVALPLGVCAAFWLPAMGAARGFFPAPLDDVYIHFGFARSLAEGHPFEWIPGNGYSSGETSPLYAAVLAVGWLAGFRGRFVSVFAALVAVLSVALLVRSVQRLARPCPSWLAWTVSLLPLSVGVVDWSLFSGMEVAAFVGALGGALVALDRARAPVTRRGGLVREAAQWRLGLWGAALVLLRPEAVVLVFVFAIVAARGAGARSGLAAVVRASLPGAAAVSLVLGANVLATGRAESAGAELKLLSSNPYLSDVGRARAFVENLVTFALRCVRPELPLLALALALAGLAARRTRAVSAACVLGALGWTLLVSWNGNSPFHNFRYYAPALVLVLVAAALGIAAIASLARAARGRGARAAIHAVAGTIAVATIGLGARRIPHAIDHFARAVANVRDQQIEASARLAAETPPGARVLVGDAGAIPYFSGRGAIDALGLGGFKGLPFARAAVNGEASTVELIERLDPGDRPAYLALYPNWFSAITGTFGHEIDRVTITDNVICGGTTKGIYLADWSALGGPPRGASGGGEPGVADEIDVADVVSEERHAYAAPLPAGGFTSLDVLEDARGARRFDGGRLVPAGAKESFVVRAAPAGGRARIRVRVDGGAAGLRARVRGDATELVAEPARRGAWREATAVVSGLAPGDVLELEAARGAYRDYHVWIEAP